MWLQRGRLKEPRRESLDSRCEHERSLLLIYLTIQCHAFSAKLTSSQHLLTHAHRMRVNVKYFGKFAKFTCTLTNNAPLSACTHLRRCVQGHLNIHLSSVSMTLNGIDMLDASEYLCNPTSGKSIFNLSLRDVTVQDHAGE